MDVLIPIARHTGTGEEVFIDEVPSGLACECECLGCAVPLVARKGDINVHHFAHVSREINDEVFCPLSFERSIVWMIRKILSDTKSIALPGYTIQYRHKLLTEPYKAVVTSPSQQSIDSVIYLEGDDKVSGVKPDVALLDIAGHKLAFTLTQRKPQGSYRQPFNYEGQDIARLEFYTGDLQNSFNRAKQGYRAILERMIVNTIENKFWVYHPREEQYRLEFKSRVDVIEREIRAQRERQEQQTQKIIRPVEPVHVYQTETKRDEIKLIPSKPRRSRLPIYQSRESDNNKAKEGLDARLKELVDQLRGFRKKGYTQGCRCLGCRFMNPPDSLSCEYCQADEFDHIELNENYMDSIEKKYSCWNYPWYSLKKLPMP